MQREVIKATSWGLAVTIALALLIVIGSRNLAHFDAALVGYTFSVLFATFGLTYRYAMWLQRPPTAMYWRRGWQGVFPRGGGAGLAGVLPARMAAAQLGHLGPARWPRRDRQSLHLRAGSAARAHPHAHHV